MFNIPFNRPHVTGREVQYIAEACDRGHLSGDGLFTGRCQRWLEEATGATRALLTTSGTSALEMTAILADIGPGDEVIMPSYTFSSSANAFVLRGGVPVFIDIRPDTMNMDEALIEAAVTPRTRAIMVMHYAGVPCDMEPIMAVAERHNLVVIEDAAQGLLSSYRGRPVGGIGHMAAFSFHETKNIIAGEGGAILINDPRVVQRAEIIREKGTNRTAFHRGETDKYTWVDLGSSFLPSEIIAAFLWAQLEGAKEITARRLALWNRYHERFAPLEAAGLARRPICPDDTVSNGHIYYLLLPSREKRDALIASLRAVGIMAVFHYIPLHSAPAGTRFGRANGAMTHTDDLSHRLVRLPLWVDLGDRLDEVAGHVLRILGAGDAS
ncbi:dTDP-4-amino-4,6-dideoxygalactose transaminase [Azospirillum argentinense]|uniref:dTDP-4-amino-4,6-dideoxygalactose transaminase n=1 Tax=Azospirillum argentinense TaxID=2970906 RepID=A0A5B0KRH9_9PROT|nr:dTDP-4-amino-4,6-dideoxygalactose transaminase [Azospirillum argentinense]KAA1054038.1 dTDP-4-amino-4,6-dideoxygalactose transaminase [Azospirillum argentinense]